MPSFDSGVSDIVGAMRGCEASTGLDMELPGAPYASIGWLGSGYADGAAAG